MPLFLSFMAVYLSCSTIKDIYIVVLFVNNKFLMFEGSVLPLKVMSNNSTFNNIQCDAQGDFLRSYFFTSKKE